MISSDDATINPRFWALFCTTEVPIQVINKILLSCIEISKHSIYVADDDPNPWSLMSSPDQTHFDKPTTPPLTGDPPRGFIDATFEDMGASLKKHFHGVPPNLSISEIQSSVADDAFAIIDARSLEDETFRFVRWELYDERIDPTSPDDKDEAFRTVEGLIDMRVPLVMATEMVNCIGMELLIHDFNCHLDEYENDVRFRKDQIDERKKTIGLSLSESAVRKDHFSLQK